MTFTGFLLSWLIASLLFKRRNADEYRFLMARTIEHEARRP
jgi:hypothetical protein